MREVLIKIVIFAGLSYLGLSLLAYFVQHRLTYFPDTSRIVPEAAGLRGVAEWVVETPDRGRIVLWRADAKPGQPTILYFHGNAAGLANRAPRVAFFQSQGWGAVIMAYRGYAGSSGSPSERNNFADAKLVCDKLVAEGIPASDILLYGESLGTGVAVELAASRNGAGGVILEAPYTSLVDVAATYYGFLPLSLLMRERYDSIERIGKIGAPLLILHGVRDGVIPFGLGQRLHARAAEPKRLVEFPYGGHSDLYWPPNDAGASVIDFIKSIRSPKRN